MIFSWQQQQWSRLAAQRSGNRLSHALMFRGPEGTGKKQFAESLAQAILCTAPTESSEACGRCESCKLFSAGTHPDYHPLWPTPPDNSTSKQPVLSIKIPALRALYQTLSETSHYDGYRIAVIYDADKMNISAANSLLKTLEEPCENALLVLVTSYPHKLPVTIRSRCQSVVFPVPDRAAATQWLERHHTQQAELAIRLSHGAPLKAAGFDEDMQAIRAQLLAALASGEGGASPVPHASELSRLPRERLLPMFSDCVDDVIRLMVLGNRAELVNIDQRKLLEARARKADRRKIHALKDHVSELIRAESTALNLQLMWENLLISWNNV